MRKKSLKLMILVLCITMLTMLAACGGTNSNNASPGTSTPSSGQKNDDGNAEELEQITITFFDKNYGNEFTNDVAKEITRKTGVFVEILPQTGNVEEKLNLMLAGGDYPDVILMDRSSPLVDKYISAGAVIPLNDLIEEYGPDIKEMYGNTLNRSRSEDGKNYYLSNWYGPDNDPMYGMLMRKDWLKELAPEKAEGGVHFTGSEFIQLLKDFKAKYPEVDGKKSIPFTMNGESMSMMILGAFKGMFGIKTYYETADGLKLDVFDPRYKDMALYMNTMHLEGLLDPNWAVSKQQIWEQQLSTGHVFATPAAYWDVGNANNALREGDDDRAFFAYKVVADGLDPAETTYSPRNMLGWDAIMITKKNKYPERTMQFFNFLSSEEGQYLMQWGVEGIHWDMIDGKHVPRQSVFDLLATEGYGIIQSTGIRNWVWSVNNGSGKDGTPYDLLVKYNRNDSFKMAEKNLGDTIWDSTPYDNLTPPAGSIEALSYQKIQDVMKQGLPRVILAETAEKASEAFDNMLAEIKKAGSDDVEKIINENYEKRMKNWE